MIPPVVARGLAWPALVAGLTLIAGVVGGAAAALVVLALGAAIVVGLNLWHQWRVTTWAAGPLDAPVPDGPGAWSLTFGALYRRTRTRAALARDLAQTIERFQRAAEAIPDGMVVIDRDGRIRWANPRAALHLGVDRSGDIGRPIVNLMRQPEAVRYVEQGDWSEPLILDSQRQPGVTLSLQLVPFGTEDRLLISRDISRLEAVARMRRDFIANVSHELKTPLTVVVGFVETMQDLDLDSRQRARYLQLMADQARSMKRLVDNLLTLSALESGQNPAHEQPFAVVPLLLSLSADAKALSKGEHAIVLDIGTAATVTGNREELASAFLNLVSNAVRYTPPGGTITLRWSVDDDGSGRFAVSDTGIGIATEHVPRLTERFYRVDRSRSRATGGTGLGLAIVKHVLLRHQAELVVDSEPGKGSTFAVRVPASRVHPAATDAPVDAMDDRPRNGDDVARSADPAR